MVIKMIKNKKLWNILKESVRDSVASPKDVIDEIYENGSMPLYDIAMNLLRKFSRKEIAGTYMYLPEENEYPEFGTSDMPASHIANIKHIIIDALLETYEHYDKFDEVYGGTKGIDLYSVPDFAVKNFLIPNNPPIY